MDDISTIKVGFIFVLEGCPVDYLWPRSDLHTVRAAARRETGFGSKKVKQKKEESMSL